jgi:hypothetical protein
MKTDATKVLTLIATLLEQPANRFGKIEFYSEEAIAAREQIRLLSVQKNLPPARSVLEQAAKVARAVLAQ